uniref:Uncharacterized protein LOC112807555 n=1 Tax=Callorhinus ursinus TaxID=34884 RepID=A0A3Q7MHH6_CALUR|nr:uncharacterized protein LOC112807555 [Callorhinus ursinus]XP_025706352.1 uncharacterized protein LOC112807647 [Callorhinus ursinus]
MTGVFFPLPTAPSTGPWNVCRMHEGAMRKPKLGGTKSAPHGVRKVVQLDSAQAPSSAIRRRAHGADSAAHHRPPEHGCPTKLCPGNVTEPGWEGSCLLGNCGRPAREHPQAQDSDVGQEGSRARLWEESPSLTPSRPGAQRPTSQIPQEGDRKTRGVAGRSPIEATSGQAWLSPSAYAVSLDPHSHSSSVKMQIITPAQSDQGNRFEVSNTATKDTTATFPATHMSGQFCLGKPSLPKPRLALLTVALMLHPQGLGPPAMPTEFKRNQAAKTDDLQITIRPN